MSFPNWGNAYVDGTTPVPAVWLNGMAVSVSRAVDGVNGGVNALASPLTFTGALVTVPALTATGVATFQSNSSFANVPTLSSPATIAKFASLKDIAWVANAATGFTTATRASVVLATMSGVSGAPCLETRTNAAAGDGFILELDVPDGATLVDTKIWTMGLVVATPSAKATYQLVKWDGVNIPQAIGLPVNDAHTYGGGNWLTTFVSTTATAGVVVDRTQYSYGLYVANPGDVGTGDRMQVSRAQFHYTPAKLRA